LFPEKNGGLVLKPKVVYILGLPRTGSTLAKRYLGEFKDYFVLVPYGDFRQAWERAQTVQAHQIVVDKNTTNLRNVSEIYGAYGNRVVYCGIVRDPRDEFVSLFETTRHGKIPRDPSFWTYWCESYSGLLDFAARASSAGARVALVRYEDLVRFPRAIKGRFLEWLGIPFSTADITETYTPLEAFATERDRSEDFKTHRTNRVHDASVGRWCRRTWRLGRVRVLRALAQHDDAKALMERFGYADTVKDLDIAALESRGLTFLRTDKDTNDCHQSPAAGS